ncbi:MAG: phosphotransferase enzyme family protein [Allorhizobium sp.]
MMTSETDFHAPAHPGYDPVPMQFSPVENSWLVEALADLSIAKIRKAEDGSGKANSGYYQLTLGNGRLLFAKVKSGERADKEMKAAALSSRLNRLGAATLAAERTDTRQDGLSLFLYPWIEPAFYDDSLKGLSNMGEALALLHGKMRDLPERDTPSKHLFHLWEDKLRLMPASGFAEGNRRALSGAGEVFARVTGQTAHNDIHRGNVIFDAAKVVAFIDFEDAVEISSSPLVDIAASLERFCLSPHPSKDKVRALLTGYARSSDGTHEATASELVQVGLCRCYHALAILELSKAPENPAWIAEKRKFLTLLDRWPEWEEIVGGAFPRLRI